MFASSDLLAMGVVRALIDNGLHIPNDVSVIGHDDSSAGAGFVPALTTVRQNWSDGGILFAKKMLDLIEGRRPKSEQLPTMLIVRDT